MPQDKAPPDTVAANVKPGLFAADLQALDLGAEDQAKIASSIQRAVIGELASMDIAPRLRIDFSGPEGFGSTGGVALAPLET